MKTRKDELKVEMEGDMKDPLNVVFVVKREIIEEFDVQEYMTKIAGLEGILIQLKERQKQTEADMATWFSFKEKGREVWAAQQKVWEAQAAEAERKEKEAKNENTHTKSS